MSSAPSRGLSIFGFPLRVSPFFFLLCAALAMPSSYGERDMLELAIWIGVVTISVLWHELGHAFAMRGFGYAPAIELTGMGGLTHWGAGDVRTVPSPGQRVLVSLAGPFAGFALGAVFVVAWLALGGRGHWALQTGLELAWQVNIGWGVLNLVPMVPWDGGNVVHGLLDMVTKGKGRKPTGIITIVVGIALLLLTALVLQELWLSFLVVLSLIAGVRMLRAPAAPTRPPGADLAAITTLLGKLGPDAIVFRVLQDQADPAWGEMAQRIEAELLPRVAGIPERAQALELAAWAYLLAGKPVDAERAVSRIPASHDPSEELAALLAAKRGSPEDALVRARELEGGGGEIGARFALETDALIALDRVEEAIALSDRSSQRTAGAFVDERLFARGRFDAAATLAERIFGRFGDPKDAYNAACSHARAGRPLEGLAWLERAIEAGFGPLDQIERDDDLASVRSLPEFDRVRERVRS